MDIRVAICTGVFHVYTEIENSLEKFQSIVKGNIEIPFIMDELSSASIDCIVNDEGLYTEEPSIVFVENNEVVGALYGTVIFTSHKDGEQESLNDQQIQLLKKIIFDNEGIIHFQDKSKLVKMIYV